MITHILKFRKTGNTIRVTQMKLPLTGQSLILMIRTGRLLNHAASGQHAKSGWKGIGWFRLYITIDSGLLNKPIALNVIHMGASEVYIDGKLFARFGTVGNTKQDEKKFQCTYTYSATCYF